MRALHAARRDAEKWDGVGEVLIYEKIAVYEVGGGLWWIINLELEKQ